MKQRLAALQDLAPSNVLPEEWELPSRAAQDNAMCNWLRWWPAAVSNALRWRSHAPCDYVQHVQKLQAELRERQEALGAYSSTQMSKEAKAEY